MVLRRFFMVLFVLTQISAVAAAPMSGQVTDLVVDSSASAGVVVAEEHCAVMSDGAAPVTLHEECSDGCQLCAACAPGLVNCLLAEATPPDIDGALFRPIAAAAGTPSAPLRPPALS